MSGGARVAGVDLPVDQPVEGHRQGAGRAHGDGDHHRDAQAGAVRRVTDGVQVIEVVPPGVRTTLLGQEDNEHAMPLDDFLTETLDLLRAKPDAKPENILRQPGTLGIAMLLESVLLGYALSRGKPRSSLKRT